MYNPLYQALPRSQSYSHKSSSLEHCIIHHFPTTSGPNLSFPLFTNLNGTFPFLN